MNDEERYDRARKRVDALKGFYFHLASFIVVNIGLFIIDLLTGDDWWFYWALIGWGIGILWHARSLFVFAGRAGGDWERRKIREFMEKDERR